MYSGPPGGKEDGGGKRAVGGTPGGTPAVDCGTPAVAAAISDPGVTNVVAPGSDAAGVGVTGPANVVEAGGTAGGAVIVPGSDIVGVGVTGPANIVEAGGTPGSDAVGVGVTGPANVGTGVGIVGAEKVVDIVGAAGAVWPITNEPAGEASSGAEPWRVTPDAKGLELEVRNGADPGAAMSTKRCLVRYPT